MNVDPFAQKKPAKKGQGTSVNPFAKAMAETEHSFASSDQKPTTPDNPFSEALARTGGQLGDFPKTPESPQDMEKKARKDALRKKLHDQVNPISNKEVFDSQARQVAADLEHTRQEIKFMIKEFAALRMDVDIAAMKQVVQPGRQGTYYISYFQQLRQFIQLLRKQIKSARTWMQQSQAKNKKKRKGGKKPGMEVSGGTKQEQSSTVFDTMHHERSTAYSGS
jgi:hypothetical protein